MVSQASFVIIFRQQLTGYLRLSTGFNELQSSDVVNSCIITMDYCNAKLAPTTAKLTVLFHAISERKENDLVSQYTQQTMVGTLFLKVFPREV